MNNEIQKIRIKDFFNFIYARQLIYNRRFVNELPSPWTKDPILSKYRFCNVYRELDKCSVYLINKVANNKKLSLEAKIFNIIFFRRFNTFGFFDYICPLVRDPKKFSLVKYEEYLDRAKERKFKLFNEAYIVSATPFNPNYRKYDKHIQQLEILRSIKDKIHSLNMRIHRMSLQQLHKYLKENIYGTGDFMAYQYIQDIAYFPEFKTLLKSGKWDFNKFIVLGPGSLPGLQYIFDTKEKRIEHLAIQLHSLQYKYLKKKWNEICYKENIFGTKETISLSDIQNCLCEFRKYVNLKTKPKSRKRIFYPKNY